MTTKDYQDWVRRVLVPVSFRSLTDTPRSFSGVANQLVRVNDTETGLEFWSLIFAFLGLSDTPGDYTGHAGEFIKVKLDESGLEFSWAGDIPSGKKILFKENSAPIGWAFVAEDNDRVILNTSTEADGGSTGGSWTISGLSVDGHALSEAELPSISGNFETRRLMKADHTLYTGASGKMSINYLGGASVGDISSAEASTANYNADVVSINFGSGNAHNHGITAGGNWRPAYSKVITCQKN